jgi:hypothetical protein
VVIGRGLLRIESPVDEAGERFGREGEVGGRRRGGGEERGRVGGELDAEAAFGIGGCDTDDGRVTGGLGGESGGMAAPRRDGAVDRDAALGEVSEC